MDDYESQLIGVGIFTFSARLFCTFVDFLEFCFSAAILVWIHFPFPEISLWPY